MKKRFLIPAAGVLLAIGVIVYFLQQTARPPEKSQSRLDRLALTTSTDPTLVFQKAFWRRPDSAATRFAWRPVWSPGAQAVGFPKRGAPERGQPRISTPRGKISSGGARRWEISHRCRLIVRKCESAKVRSFDRRFIHLVCDAFSPRIGASAER